MEIYRTYIQQLSYDGIEYTKGDVVDLYDAFNIVCRDFPFEKNPSPKDLPTRDWAGEDGLDVYVPDKLPMKSYDIEVDFLYVGNEKNIRCDLNLFIDFIYGRNCCATGSRLAIYNEHTGIGRKDVVVSEVSNDLFYLTDADPDAVATFKVKFKVYDPTTDVCAWYGNYNGKEIVTDLYFE